MSDSSFLVGVIVGVIVGSMIFAGILAITPSYHRHAVDAKEACEQSLSRDQVCKITAVPVDKEQK